MELKFYNRTIKFYKRMQMFKHFKTFKTVH